jgi:phosphatidylserine/phosphatidylglycerophosphate/cardiolipin synthase-like enzyme
VKLLQQPEDGASALINGINNAKNSIDILIFRFDQPEIERALADAVSRGISVQALIAHINGSGEESLRKLEMRLLAAGITVARTSGGLVRYHAKLMVIDRSELYLLAFNFTRLDIKRSRSFGIVTKDPKLVREALKLVEADAKRQPYEPGLSTFVVSPENARKELSSFIEGAERELLIYDPEISDRTMIRLLEERAKADVDIKLIGKVLPANSWLSVRRLISPRLHTRVIIRDRRTIFIGSQSLREMELDRRREAGVILHDSTIVNQVAKTFLEDWSLSKPIKQDAAQQPSPPPLAKMAKKVAKAVVRELPPVSPVVDATIKEMMGERPELTLDAEEVEESVRDAVKNAVKEVVQEMVEEVGHNQV